jgi:hypothetical protein
MMKLKSERGQAVLAVVLLLGLIVLAIYFGLMATNQRQMKAGADAIGNMAGNAIDEAARQKQDDIDWQVANGTVVSFWVNNQRIPTTDHAIARHGAEGVVAIQCYNDHGAFFIQANRKGDWYIHCLEEDGKTVRTTFWQRVGNQFHLESAYTKGDGAWSWSQIRTFFESKWGATKATFPADGVLYVDGVPAPYVP